MEPRHFCSKMIKVFSVPLCTVSFILTFYEVTTLELLLLQSSESVKELYTLLKEKLEASKKSPPEPEEAPSLDLSLHPVAVPSTPTTPH